MVFWGKYPFNLEKVILVTIYHYQSMKKVTHDWFSQLPIHKTFSICYNAHFFVTEGLVGP